MDSKIYRIELSEDDYRLLLLSLQWYVRDLKRSVLACHHDFYIERASSLYDRLEDDFDRKFRSYVKGLCRKFNNYAAVSNSQSLCK